MYITFCLFKEIPTASKGSLTFLYIESIIIVHCMHVSWALLTFYEKFLSVGEREIFHSPGLVVQMNRVLLVRQVIESEVF